MMVLTRVPIGAIETLVGHAFSKDDELIEKYHIVGENYQKSILDTVDKIKTTHVKDFELKLYAINCGNQTIGYSVINKEIGILYSFGINIKYRNKETLVEWFGLIANLMPDFKCYLWNKNTRAINFLIKNGMKISEVKREFTILTYKKGEL